MKKIPILKNVYIGFVWVFVLNLWDLPGWDLYDFLLIFYFGLLSYFYDKCEQLICKFLLDFCILLPKLLLMVYVGYFLQ